LTIVIQLQHSFLFNNLYFKALLTDSLMFVVQNKRG